MTDILLELAKGNCAKADDPAPWLEPRQNAGGPHLCMNCPVLETCREYSKDKYWNTVVIGGWKAPRVTGVRASGGELPPWHDGSEYPLPTLPRMYPPPDDLELAARAAAVGMTPARYWLRYTDEGRAARRLQKRQYLNARRAAQEAAPQ